MGAGRPRASAPAGLFFFPALVYTLVRHSFVHNLRPAGDRGRQPWNCCGSGKR